MKKYLNFEAIARWDREIAYAASYNALFETNLNTGESRYICSFNENFEKNRLYTTAFKIREKIYFVPASAEKIAVYEPKQNRLYEISVEQVDKSKHKHYRVNEKFNGGVVSGKYLYLMPCTYPGVLRIDTLTDQITYFSDWVGDVNYIFRKSPTVYEDVIYLPCTIGNNILKFDTKTNEAKIVHLPTKYGSWWSMCKVGKEFWIAPRNPGPIICWNEENNLLIEYKDYPCDFKGNNFYFTLCFEHMHNVYFLPANSNMGIVIDAEKKSVNPWEICEDGSIDMYQFVAKVDNYIYIRAMRKNLQDKYIRLDCDDMSFSDFSFYISDGEELFKRDIRENMKGRVLREQTDMNLEFLISVLE